MRLQERQVLTKRLAELQPGICTYSMPPHLTCGYSVERLFCAGDSALSAPASQHPNLSGLCAQHPNLSGLCSHSF